MTDEELAAIGVRASIGHAQTTGLVSVRVAPSLILEGIAWAPCAGAMRTSALSHKARDDPMEGEPIVVPVTCQEYEVIHRLGGFGRKELQFNVTLVGSDRRSVGLA